jgi:hypothetical protein
MTRSVLFLSEYNYEWINKFIITPISLLRNRMQMGASMKKNFINIGLIIIFIILMITFILFYQAVRTDTTKDISFDKAQKEMPYIQISKEEATFMQTLKRNNSVKAAIENGQITDLSIEKGSELAAENLPFNIKVIEFSVINNTVCFGYYFKDYRIILEIYADNKIHKTICVYSKNVRDNTIYDNFNNQTYQKSTFYK